MDGRVRKEIIDYLNTAYDRQLNGLKRFLMFPSVSALPTHRQDMADAATWLKDHLKDMGMENSEVLETAGHPVVYAEWLGAPGAPTVLLYGHYDVQPVDPLHLWRSDPFKPEERDGLLFARGSSDDKGQVMLHVGALEALLAADGKLPVNVKLLIEGEEEIGSPNLAPFIAGNMNLLACDAVVISDTGMIDEGVPTICTGLRGIVSLEVNVTTADRDLHSGTYGGAAPNALHVMATLISALRTEDGRVSVPGFYDAVLEPNKEERKTYRGLPFDEVGVVEGVGLLGYTGEQSYTPFERMTIRPTLEVNGMWGGFQGEGSKTVIPNEARAKITCRLVPNQRPDEIGRIVQTYLDEICPGFARVNVTVGAGAGAWRVGADDPFVKAATRALRLGFEKEPALAPVGGSIPVVETFHTLMQVPIVILGLADADSNAHAPNEQFSLETFRVGRIASVLLWEEIAMLKQR